MSELALGRDGKVCGCAGTERWQPVPLATLAAFVETAVPRTDGRNSGYIVNRNIASSVQFAQFLARTVRDGLPTPALRAQVIKTYVVTVCSVIEATLVYTLRARHNVIKRVWASQLCAAYVGKEPAFTEQFWANFEVLLRSRNRVHAQEVGERGQRPRRDTQINHFDNAVFERASSLLREFLSCPLFDSSLAARIAAVL